MERPLALFCLNGIIQVKGVNGMKKIITTILIIVLCLALYSCGKVQDDAAEDDVIDGIVLAVYVNGKNYVISYYVEEEEKLPEGFEYTGNVESGIYEGCEYYINENEPYWIYVKSWVGVAEESEKAYYRFVDSEIYGKDYLCVNGVLYCSSGTRMGDDLPKGFTSAGRAEFSGYDTVPEGTLSSNTGSEEVFVDENDDSTVLVRTTWFGAGNERVKGLKVYIKVEK